MVPYAQDSGSSASSESSASTRMPYYDTVIDNSDYPAVSFPDYDEKPLSEQLEPIAVVGMGCRLPGDIKNPSDFWNLMINKGTGRTPKVPDSRFNIDGHLHSNNERPGSFNVLGGYFLHDDLQKFDPKLFGISPIEAMWMDPQQRKLLEVVYETFESGGVTLKDISGSTTAVFVGSFTSDYQQMSFKEPDFRHSYVATGVDPGIISNRISHVFNLHGPSITVNTACSSSVYALHNACNALRNRECSGAVVGGTNLIITVDQHMNTAKLGVLSPTSTCRTFDASADGYGRADAVGAVYLKRLSDAVRDGDPIRAVIRSSAVNSNGKAPAVGITHPSLEGQKDVIQKAYRQGGDLDPRLTGYFEIHGTGTPIGDPLEVHAVALAMNNARTDADEPLLVGAVKTNIGHSEAASGLSAIIKACLTVEAGIIPPTRGLVTPNPKIHWKDWKVQVVTEPRPFSAHLPVKRVSVNSFGYGGTNGHIVIESVHSFLPEYSHGKKVMAKPADADSLQRPYLLLLSAHDKPTLKQNIAAYEKIVDNYNLLDLSYTLANRRTHHQVRGYVVASPASVKEVFGHDGAAFTIAEKKKKVLEVGFAFTGQGAQWATMGSQLIKYYPTFLATIRSLDGVLHSLPDAPAWSLETSLLEEAQTSRVNEAEFSQPLCTAIQIAIVELLLSWNIRPKVTIGHSSGEIAASFASGLLSSAEAIIVAYYRGQAVKGINTNGAMMAVGLSAENVQPYLKNYAGKVVVACHNSPSSVTLSGNADALEEIQAVLNAASIFARFIKTGGKAYHSHHMQPSAAIYEGLLQNSRATVMVSSVYNDRMGKGQVQVVDEQYWCKNLVSPVLFNQAMQTILRSSDLNVDAFIEIGPHTALSGPIKQIAKELGNDNLGYIPTLVRNQDSAAQLLKVAGELYLCDYPVDLEAVTAVQEQSATGKPKLIKGNLLVDLPSYQWHYPRKLWAESRQSLEHRTARYLHHDILGSRMPGCSAIEPVWRNILRIRDLPWLRDHSLGGEAIFPAAGYFSMAIEAATQLHERSGSPVKIESYVLRDISIKSALVTPDNDQGIEVLFTMRPSIFTEAEKGTWWDFRVVSVSEAGHWHEHSSGTIGINARRRGQTPKHIPNLPRRTTGKAWNEGLREVGFDYGPIFQGMSEVQSDGKNCIAATQFDIKQTCGALEGESRYVLHPGTVDLCLQLIIISIYAGKLNDMPCGAVPSHVVEVALWPPTADQLAQPTSTAYSFTDQRGTRSFVSGSQLVASNGELLMDITGMRVVSYEAAVPQHAEEAVEPEPYQEMVWKCDIDSLAWTNKVPGLDALELVRLLAHKSPGAKVLEIGTNNTEAITSQALPIHYTVVESTDEAVETTKAKFSEATNLQVKKLDLSGSLPDEDVQTKYDLVIATGLDPLETQQLDNIRRLLQESEGRLVIQDDTMSNTKVHESFQGVEIYAQKPATQLLSLYQAAESVANGDDSQEVPKEITLVYREQPAEITGSIEKALAALGYTMKRARLDAADAQDGDAIIILADLEGAPVLATVQEKEFTGIKHLTSKASSLLWVTAGGLLAGKKPEYAMTNGLARSVSSEQASLTLTTLDFDAETTSPADLASLTAKIAHRQLQAGTSDHETEFCVAQGQVYISRLVANRGQAVTQSELFQDGQHFFAQAQSGKITWVADKREFDPLVDVRTVEVKLLYGGLNKEDTTVITGNDHLTTFSHEICGVVSRAGADVTEFTAGDLVVGFSFDRFATFQCTSADLLQKVETDDVAMQLASVPWSVSTALYGLQWLAHIDAGETVLVLGGTGTVGAAAVRIAQALGATPFIVAVSEAEANSLACTFDLPRTQVAVLEVASLVADMEALTHGRGFNIVFGSSASSADPVLARECWRHMSPLGRFVDFGRKNMLQHSLLDTLPLHQSASYLSFDLLDLYAHKPQTLAKLLRASVALFRKQESVRQIVTGTQTPEVFALADIDAAVASFSDNITSPKKLIAYDQTSDSVLDIVPTQPTPRFRADATYFLVGCLGGLGRSLTSWMVENGARRFAFLSRSGTDQSQARLLVEDLEAAGISCQVIRGDVAIKEDVEQAVANIPAEFPIRGVVQAAMVLRDGLFHSMSYENWKTAVRPKVLGTRNLHAALGDMPLDFFMLTSSTSGTLGMPGQANYSAANSFLDSLARHRLNHGQSACSVVLPMVLGVGYVAEHPEVEEALRRKGIYGIDETHLLESFAAAILAQSHAGVPVDHVVVGLDPVQLKKAISSSDTTDGFWLEDVRFKALLESIKHTGEAGGAGGAEASRTILTTIRTAPTAAEAVHATSNYFTQKLSRLLMLDLDVFEPDGKAIADYGLDSMIGAELRNWIFKELGLDIPFQRLLGPDLTITKFAIEVCANQGVVSDER